MKVLKRVTRRIETPHSILTPALFCVLSETQVSSALNPFGTPVGLAIVR